MRDLRKRAWGIGISLALCIGGSACGPESPADHAGQGIVEAVDLDARKVTLDHGDIPGLMKGMTMEFDVAPDVVLDELDPGQEVDFRVREAGGVYTVTQIQDPTP